MVQVAKELTSAEWKRLVAARRAAEQAAAELARLEERLRARRLALVTRSFMQATAARPVAIEVVSGGPVAGVHVAQQYRVSGYLGETPRFHEGDAPPRFGEVTVYVAPPLPDGTALYVRVQRDRAAEERARVTALRQLLEQPDGMRGFVAEVIGREFGDAARARPALVGDARAILSAALARAERNPPPAPTEHWAIRPGYNGIEHAGIVVVNVRRGDDLGGAARLLDDLARLRRDRALFDDVLGWRGRRVPITAVVADLTNPRDPGTRKVLARLRRTVRAAADLDSARDID